MFEKQAGLKDVLIHKETLSCYPEKHLVKYMDYSTFMGKKTLQFWTD